MMSECISHPLHTESGPCLYCEIEKLEATIARLEAENTDLKWELAHYEAGGER